MSYPILNHGLRELSAHNETPCAMSRIRREDAGRKKITAEHPGLISALKSLLAPLFRSDPESALRWTIKSTRVLSEELSRMGGV